MKKILGFFVIISCLLTVSTIQSIVIDSKTIDADTSSSRLGNQNIVEIAESNTDLSTFVKALKEAGLQATLEGPGPFTVFAPSNDAFAALPQDVMQELMKNENRSRLAGILKNHIAKGNLVSSSLNSSNINSLGGKPLHIEVRGSQILINNASVVQSDLTGSNGVIQVIDTVLFVP